MGSKSDIYQDKEKSANAENNIPPNIVHVHDTPPIYYDSEPSSQPPRYPHNQSTQNQPASTPKPPTLTTTPSKPANQHRNSAPASTIHAILASPYDDLDAQRRADRKKKTLRQRWRDFKDRNFHDDYDVGGGDSGASGPELNVMGGRLKGGLTSPYRKK